MSSRPRVVEARPYRSAGIGFMKTFAALALGETALAVAQVKLPQIVNMSQNVCAKRH